MVKIYRVYPAARWLMICTAIEASPSVRRILIICTAIVDSPSVRMFLVVLMDHDVGWLRFGIVDLDRGHGVSRLLIMSIVHPFSSRWGRTTMSSSCRRSCRRWSCRRSCGRNWRNWRRRKRSRRMQSIV